MYTSGTNHADGHIQKTAPATRKQVSEYSHGAVRTRITQNSRKTALIYLAASVFCAVFGAVYEIFSHGVISAFMVCAFLFPLLGGFLPFLLLYLAGRMRRSLYPGIAAKMWGRHTTYPGIAARSLYHCGIIALTGGSIMTGILEIYGTTNGLTAAYWFAGAILLLAGIVTHLAALLRQSVQSTF